MSLKLNSKKKFNYENVHFFSDIWMVNETLRIVSHITIIISLFLFLFYWCIKPPNNFALTSQSRHKDISRSPAGHLLNSSAYVSLIRVCKSIARREEGRVRENEQGWRIACGQVVGVRASMSCGLYDVIKNSPFLDTSRYHSHGEGLLQGGQIGMNAIRILQKFFTGIYVYI